MSAAIRRASVAPQQVSGRPPAGLVFKNRRKRAPARCDDETGVGPVSCPRRREAAALKHGLVGSPLHPDHAKCEVKIYMDVQD